jgi:hypothetical protein
MTGPAEQKNPITMDTSLSEVRRSISRGQVDDVDAVVSILSDHAEGKSQKPVTERYKAAGILTELGVNFPEKTAAVAGKLLALAETVPAVRDTALTGIGILARTGLLDETAVTARVDAIQDSSPVKRDYIRSQFRDSGKPRESEPSRFTGAAIRKPGNRT